MKGQSHAVRRSIFASERLTRAIDEARMVEAAEQAEARTVVWDDSIIYADCQAPDLLAPMPRIRVVDICATKKGT